MKCSGFLKRIDRYIDHELSETERQAAVEHLQDCSNCSTQVARFEALRTELAAFDIAEPPAGLVADMMRAVDAPAPARPFRSWLLWPAGAAASLAAVVLGYMVGAAALAPESATVEQGPGVSAVPVAELKLEEPFTLLPGAEETLVLLAFNDETEGNR